MPRLPKIFGRKQVADAPDSLAEERKGGDTFAADSTPNSPIDDTPADGVTAPEEQASVAVDANGTTLDAVGADAPATAVGRDDAVESVAKPDQDPLDPPVPLDTGANTSPATEPAGAPSPLVPPAVYDAERRGTGESKTLIGGKEADLVPMIPDTEVDIAETNDLDDESIVGATVEALFGACELVVKRVNILRKMQDGTQIVAGLIALVTELDARYTSDWGIVRRNGLEEVLIEVRDSVVEGDLFILESLENGKGGLTAEVFLRDLRTIAPADRPRMIAAYAMFLVFMLKCVLRQYVRPLEHDQPRLREVTHRLDYLMDGIRDSLLARINGIPRLG